MMQPLEARKMPGFISMASRFVRIPVTQCFVMGLNWVLVKHLPEDTLEYIDGKTLRVHVLDIDLKLDYRWNGQAFESVKLSEQAPDVTFAATAKDFYVLMQRQEDPDTLFFSRRLMIEGDTELGLILKNSLDAIDLQVLKPRAVLSDTFTGVRTQLRSRMRL